MSITLNRLQAILASQEVNEDAAFSEASKGMVDQFVATIYEKSKAESQNELKRLLASEVTIAYNAAMESRVADITNQYKASNKMLETAQAEIERLNDFINGLRASAASSDQEKRAMMAAHEDFVKSANDQAASLSEALRVKDSQLEELQKAIIAIKAAPPQIVTAPPPQPTPTHKKNKPYRVLC